MRRTTQMTLGALAVVAGVLGGRALAYEPVEPHVLEVGDPVAKVKRMLGEDGLRQPAGVGYHLRYRSKFGIDMAFSKDRIYSMMVYSSAKCRHQKGIAIGRTPADVFRAFGKPRETRTIEKKDMNARSPRRIYFDQGDGDGFIGYTAHEMFWFEKGKLIKFATEGPVIWGAFDLVPAVVARDPLNEKVTLKTPYPVSYKGAPTDKTSVQYAVIELAKQAGLKYSWKASYKNTDPLCRRWVTPSIERVPFDQAMTGLLGPLGLGYSLEGQHVVLHRTSDEEARKARGVVAALPPKKPGVAEPVVRGAVGTPFMSGDLSWNVERVVYRKSWYCKGYNLLVGKEVRSHVYPQHDFFMAIQVTVSNASDQSIQPGDFTVLTAERKEYPRYLFKLKKDEADLMLGTKIPPNTKRTGFVFFDVPESPAFQLRLASGKDVAEVGIQGRRK